MKKIKIMSSQNNEYYYDDASGFIYPAMVEPIVVESDWPKGKVKADNKNVWAYLSANGFRQLLLEVTQGCNMRCRYCTYSEYYKNTRSHGSSMMSYDTAIAAVHYYMTNFEKLSYKNPMRKPTISFYGGEPLLNLDLIRHVVAYVGENYPQFKVTYNMTTNGLLLTEETGDFLVEHNFSITISLDGDEENHDRNRRKADGSGSFQQVFSNLESFRKRHPDYSRLGASICMDYHTDLVALAEFFKKNNIFIVILNMVSSYETDYYNNFTPEDRKRFEEQMAVMKKRYMELAEEEGILISDYNFLLSLFGMAYVEMTFHSLIGRGRPECMPCTGSCIPGEKIYVTISGEYHMCERISPHFPIGDIKTGLNLDAIAKYVNELNKFSAKCRECDISRMCNICLARSTEQDKIVLSEVSCEERKEYIRNTLKEYIDLMEAKPDQMDRIITSYYKELKAVAGDIMC